MLDIDFDRIHIKNGSDLKTFHPRNLSRNLIVRLESDPASLLRNQFVTSPTQNLFIWITVLGMSGYILSEPDLALRGTESDRSPPFSF